MRSMTSRSPQKGKKKIVFSQNDAKKIRSASGRKVKPRALSLSVREMHGNGRAREDSPTTVLHLVLHYPHGSIRTVAAWASTDSRRTHRLCNADGGTTCASLPSSTNIVDHGVARKR